MATTALATVGWPIFARTHPRATTLTAAVILAADVLAVAGTVLTTGHVDVWLVLLVFGAAFAWCTGGCYRCRVTVSILDDIPHLLSGLLVATGAVVIANSMPGSSEARRLLASAAALFGLVVLLRTLGYALLRRTRRAGHLVRNAVIVGSGEMGTRLADDLIGHPECGLRVAGFVDEGFVEGGRDFPYVLPAPVLGETSTLNFWVKATQSEVIVLADTTATEHRLLDLLRAHGDLDCEILLVPRVGVPTRGRSSDRAWSVPLVRLEQPAQERPSWLAKRCIDIVVAGTALALLAPVMLLTALAVRIETGPSVIFQQERVGRHGRLFTLLKFRSLRPADDFESRTTWNIANDHRLGPVGRIIRATSLDELPQLVNILRGDMSLVGPRPERPFFAERFAEQMPHYNHRHRVPVGLTGWAAVHGLRGDTSIAERAHFDNFYIDNWSLWTDLKVMIRTLPAMLRRVEPGVAHKANR